MVSNISTGDPTSPFQLVNRRKIFKWIYLLLEKHHHRLGLKAMGGIQMVHLFFSTALSQGSADQDFCGVYRNPIQQSHRDFIYTQTVGVVTCGDMFPHQAQRELRTDEVLPLLEAKLGIESRREVLRGRFKFPYQLQEAGWQERAAVYLYCWNVFGYWQSAQPAPARFSSLAAFPCEYGKPEWLQRLESSLAMVADPKDIYLILAPDWKPAAFWDLNGSVSLPDGSSVDLRTCQQQGKSTDHALKLVKELLADAEFVAA